MPQDISQVKGAIASRHVFWSPPKTASECMAAGYWPDAPTHLWPERSTLHMCRGPLPLAIALSWGQIGSISSRKPDPTAPNPLVWPLSLSVATSSRTFVDRGRCHLGSSASGLRGGPSRDSGHRPPAMPDTRCDSNFRRSTILGRGVSNLSGRACGGHFLGTF